MNENESLINELGKMLAENIPGVPEDVQNGARVAAGLAAYYFGNLVRSGLTRDEALHLTTVWIQSRYGAAP